jgi:hypothetical protein
LSSLPALTEAPLGPFAAETRAVQEGKKLVLLVAGSAAQRYGDDLAEQQEILAALSDMILDLYLAESALLRGCRLLAVGCQEEEGTDRRQPPATTAARRCPAAHGYPDSRRAATTVFINDMVGRLEARTREVLATLAVGDELRAQLAALRRFTRWTPIDTISLRRQIAAAVLSREGYPE